VISAPGDIVVDSCSVRAKRGGDLVWPNPTDRGKPGTKYHVAVDADGLPLAAVLLRRVIIEDSLEGAKATRYRRKLE
jgi:hypothetical protein